MDFYTVCTPPKYNTSHVERLFNLLSIFYSQPFELHCYYQKGMILNSSTKINYLEIPNKPYKCEAQWNKIDFFNPSFYSSSKPIVVLDLDWTFVGDITSVIDIPIQHDEIYTIERWWRHPKSSQPVNGGMYKFFSQSGKEIYDSFIERPIFWQTKYVTKYRAPPTGEQDFVFEHAKLAYNKLCFFDSKRILRYVDTNQLDNNVRWADIKIIYEKKFKQKCMINGEYNSNICMIHGIF